MGPTYDPSAVIDPELSSYAFPKIRRCSVGVDVMLYWRQIQLVHGIAGLRVVDASINAKNCNWKYKCPNDNDW
ncbi:hypothetical protein Avbf_16044 [Armadillidium vulgare]|nr:hypothetical protein Avbf_16044 [Armadillidium vulgare]